MNRSVSHETPATVLSERLKATAAAKAQKFQPGQVVRWAQSTTNAGCRIVERVRDDVYRVDFGVPMREFSGASVVCLDVAALRGLTARETQREEGK